MSHVASVVALSVSLLVGCFPPPEHCEPADELFGNCPESSDGRGGGGGGGGVSTYAVPPKFVVPYTPSGSSCLGIGICPLAVGGTMMQHVMTNDAANPVVSIVGGPVLSTLWYAGDREEVYALTTMSIEGDTTVTLTSANYPTIAGVIHVRDVRDVQQVSLDDSYEPAAPNPAFRTRTNFTVGLLGEPNSWGGPTYLSDATLSINHTLLVRDDKPVWDTFVGPTSAGHHTVRVTADSIGFEDLVFDTVAGIDRLEAVVVGEPITGGTSRVCFHGYMGEREVVTKVELVTSTDVSIDGTRNCARVKFPVGATRRVVTATAHGYSNTVELLVP